MLNYCTLFDSNYLTRGLAMYESLKKWSKDFHLFIFAFDDRSLEALRQLELSSVTVISLQEFEDEELLRIKDDRTTGEYCWTCTPSIIKYSMEKYGLESCTYLDADLYFFADPSVLIEEMRNKSILITGHRYSPEYDQCATNGIYCVQFITFKNDINGMKILNWWRDACNRWCYARCEDGKFGDQKYLDDWPERFEGVHVLQHLGGGVAPWNVQQYSISNSGNKCYGLEKKTGKSFEFVFYHFHYLKFYDNSRIDLSTYKLSSEAVKLIYEPYLGKLLEIGSNLKDTLNIDFDPYGQIQLKKDIKTLLKTIKRYLQGNYNVLALRGLEG